MGHLSSFVVDANIYIIHIVVNLTSRDIPCCPFMRGVRGGTRGSLRGVSPPYHVVCTTICMGTPASYVVETDVGREWWVFLPSSKRLSGPAS